MKIIKKLNRDSFPKQLLEIPEPPQTLYVIGNLPRPENKVLCVIGSRKYTPYGKEACEHIVSSLKGYPITIVSGLALGIDSIAHKAAIKAGLQTIALPGSGLNDNVLYPNTNRKLANDIVACGGGLVSEFELGFKAVQWAFPKRNRIMAGMSHAVLVIEAEIKSGTMITSRLATDYNRDVFAIPGSIFSKKSQGPNLLIKLGARPVITKDDILEELGIVADESNGEDRRSRLYSSATAEQRVLLNLLDTPQERNELIAKLGMATHIANALISISELEGMIVERNGRIHRNSE